MNTARAKEYASELVEGKRTWYLNGSYDIARGFYLFPEQNSEVAARLSEGRRTISRVLTEEEARELVKDTYCKNKEITSFTLAEVDKLRKNK